MDIARLAAALRFSLPVSQKSICQEIFVVDVMSCVRHGHASAEGERQIHNLHL